MNEKLTIIKNNVLNNCSLMQNLISKNDIDVIKIRKYALDIIVKCDEIMISDEFTIK